MIFTLFDVMFASQFVMTAVRTRRPLLFKSNLDIAYFRNFLSGRNNYVEFAVTRIDWLFKKLYL